MNTFWLKIAGVAVAVVIVIILIGVFKSHDRQPVAESKQKEQPKTFYDVAEKDKQLIEPPKPANSQVGDHQEKVAVQPPQPAQGTVQPNSGIVLPSSITQPTTLYFKPLEEIEDIQAQELLPWAVAGRSIGRLPMVQYGLMVKACRQIEERWPDSWYAFRAKQMLEEIAERYAANYKITEQELNISRFMKPMQGTEPRIVEPIRR
jgi:hypothetical protein